MRWFIVFTVTVFCSACSSTRELHVVAAAKPAEKAALLDRVKSLAGTWETVGDDGEKGTIIYQVSSNGSLVREIMFPGSNHEMTNMYTMDGPELLMTHYCAIGNQPHMRASSAQGDRIALKTAGVSNLTASDQMYMGEMTIVFVDNDHIRQEWQSLKNGHPHEHRAVFNLTRTK